MTLGLAFSNAISGLNAGQAGLAVISQNIANANTDGYSRKVTNQSAQIIAGQINGVSIEAATRLANDFLTAELKSATSDFHKAAASDEFYRLMQNLFGSPGSNTSAANDLANFFGDMEALANNPENAGLRFNAVSAAVTVADTILTAGNEIQSLRFRTDQEIAASVGRINSLLVDVQELNVEVARAVISGAPTGDLEDKRDQSIRKIATEMDVNLTKHSDGKVSLFASNGTPLLEDKARRLVYSPAATVTATTVFGSLSVFSVNANNAISGSGDALNTSGASSAVTTNIRSGRLRGLTDMRDKELTDLANGLDALANMVRDQLNAVHNQGVGFPAPQTLTGTRTVNGTDAFNATGTVRIAVTDTTGQIVDVTDIDLAALGATDVNGVMAAINGPLAGNATATIVNNNLVITATNANNGIAINDVGTSESVTTQGFSHYFGLNDLFLGTNATTMSVRSDIRTDPSRLSTGQLSTTALVGEVGIAVGDNSIVQALATAGDTAYTFTSVGGLPASTVKLADFAASLTGLNAVRAADAADVSSRRELILENITHRHTSDTGVNLDEELATMVLFQNAFTVSARVLDAAAEMLEILVTLGSG